MILWEFMEVKQKGNREKTELTGSKGHDEKIKSLIRRYCKKLKKVKGGKKQKMAFKVIVNNALTQQ